MLPLIIMVLAALLMPPDSLDARPAMPLGSPLSEIFLQKSDSETWRDLGYPIVMDKNYLLA